MYQPKLVLSNPATVNVRLAVMGERVTSVAFTVAPGSSRASRASSTPRRSKPYQAELTLVPSAPGPCSSPQNYQRSGVVEKQFVRVSLDLRNSLRARPTSQDSKAVVFTGATPRVARL